jgi:intein/homing endonuclease
MHSKKRKLFKHEIEDIISFIHPNPNIPEETALFVVEESKKDIKLQLEKIRIYPEMLPRLKQQVIYQFSSTIIQPGESVGIITAQSIGEKQTQANLNSLDWTEQVIILDDDNAKVIEIGNLIDNILEKANKKDIKLYPENRTEYLETRNMNLFIPSCDNHGYMSWKKIEAVTRHLPLGQLVKVTTDYGRSVIATQSKSFIVWNGKEFVDKNGSELIVGDILPTTKNLDFAIKKYYLIHEDKHYKLDREFGMMIGFYLSESDNYEKNNKYETLITSICMENNKKIVPYISYTSNKEFCGGIIDGFMLCNDKCSKNVIYGMSLLLNYFDIGTKIIQNDDKYSLHIEEGGINDFPTDRDVHFDKIVDIQLVKSTTEFVYDFTVEETLNFQIFNGLNVRD